LKNCPYCGEDLNAKPEQAARHKSRRAPQWQAVKGGLERIVSGGRILAAAMLCCSGVFLAVASTPALTLGPAGVLLSLGGVVIALAVGLWFVGSCRCLSVPRQAGGRHYLGLAIGCAIASPVVPVLILLGAAAVSGQPARFAPSPWLVAWLAAIPNTLAAGAMLLFLTFLRGVSAFFGDESTTGYVEGCESLFAAWAAAYVVISAVTAGLAAAHDSMAVLGFWGMTCCWLLGAI
jgi:hypothetical protein